MEVMIVVGYPHSRSYDVAEIRRILHEKYDIKLLLVASSAKPDDGHISDFTLYTNCSDSEHDSAISAVVAYLDQHKLHARGVLPFLEPTMVLGTKIAERLKLPTSKPEAISVGRDKRLFREMEANATSRPANYNPIRARSISSIDEFREVIAEFGGAGFAKPANEGGSRGCFVVENIDACDSVWSALSEYASNGIVVEELIRNAREFSWDYVAGARWITEKETTTDAYRAEVQQIVPAPLTESEHSDLDAAGLYMRNITSLTHGVFHNEIFLKDDRTTSAVEVNMRPAGMHIWDLAKLAFNNFNPWENWVSWALNGDHSKEELAHKNYAGIRMIRAHKSGKLSSMLTLEEVANNFNSNLIEYRQLKNINDAVTNKIVDNYSFIGQIIMTNSDATELKNDLEKCAAFIEGGTVIQ